MRDGRMRLVVRRFAAGFVAALIGFLARLITAVRGVRHSDEAYTEPCVFYANHASHGDFILISTVLPPGVRAATRPVAGADYWQASRLRRFIGVDAFRSLLIASNGEHADIDPISAMAEAGGHARAGLGCCVIRHFHGLSSCLCAIARPARRLPWPDGKAPADGDADDCRIAVSDGTHAWALHWLRA